MPPLGKRDTFAKQFPCIAASALAERLKGARQPLQERTGPLWKGPEEDGITFSLLSRFLVCRERFRLLVVEGLRPADTFNHRIEYGNMWHVCEEEQARKDGGDHGSWVEKLRHYCKGLCERYPADQQQVQHWHNVCREQFLIYVRYWRTHDATQAREPFMSEEVFCIPYRLPSGRNVKLRGKWDGVFFVSQKDRHGYTVKDAWLQENKTKGDVNPQLLQRQLTCDLQTMLYLVALRWSGKVSPNAIAGVMYNVVRRPLSGGKGSIVRHKGSDGAKCQKCKGAGEKQLGGPPSPSWQKCDKCEGRGRIGGKPEESLESYYQRVAEVIKEDPGHFFMRWNTRVLAADVEKFRRECLDPILEGLCDWWQYIQSDPVVFPEYCEHGTRYNGLHYRRPFGVWNVLDEGGSSDLDEYLATGSEVGLKRTDNLFPELQGS